MLIRQIIITLLTLKTGIFMKKNLIYYTLSTFIAGFLFSCTNESDNLVTNMVSSETTNVLERNSRTASRVIFEDNFDQTGTVPDTSKWVLCTAGTSAWNKYMSASYDQAYLSNGKLVLTGELVDGVYKAGGVRTTGKVDFKYGKVEVNARFTQTAQGAWAAIWMMPTSPIYSGWPSCGEIDIMEQLNHDSYVYQTIHSYYKNTLGITTPTPTVTASYNVSEFNTYAVDWTHDRLVFSVNGVTTLTYPNLYLENESTQKQWPFDGTFHIILNQALGGAGTWPGAITNSQLPAVMEVDWVRVTQYDE